MSTPLVSIVTPVLNGARWINDCIQSVVMQRYPHIEHVIIDGGSTDQTLTICQHYPHLSVHIDRGGNQSHALNVGFEHAKGDIFAWLCADDVYEPDAIERVVASFQDGRDVVMGKSTFVDAHLNFLSEHPANDYPYYDHEMLLRFWQYHPISQPATFWTRRLWEAVKPIDETLEYTMDYDLWLRMSKITRFELIEPHLAKYRAHPETKCYTNLLASRKEMIDVCRRYWPPVYTAAFWRLFYHHRFISGPLSLHYMIGEQLMNETIEHLNHASRGAAIRSFIRMHRIHPAARFFPNYRLTFKRILKEAIGPAWFWGTVGSIGRAIKSQPNELPAATNTPQGCDSPLPEKQEICETASAGNPANTT